MPSATFYIIALTLLHFFRHSWGPRLVNYLIQDRFRESAQPLKVQQGEISTDQKNYEQKWVFRSQFVDLGIIALVLLMSLKEWTEFYWSLSDASFGYSALTLLLLFLFQDAYFYFTHRLLHTPYLYKKIHLVHHRSTQPTVMTSFSMHPLEKLIELLFYPLVIAFLPLHPALLLVYVTLSTLINFIGHSGIELKWLPSLSKAPLLYNATTVFHDMHHRYPRCNYSLYFTYLDEIFHTQHQCYKKQFFRGIPKV